MIAADASISLLGVLIIVAIIAAIVFIVRR